MSSSDSEHRNKLNRRQALLLSAAGGMGIALKGTALADESAKKATPMALAASCSTPRTAVAKKEYGKVRGYVEEGVLTFKGVPYGANTGGENRWTWTPFDPVRGQTMVFDSVCRMADDPKGQVRKILLSWRNDEETCAANAGSMNHESLCGLKNGESQQLK